jgi:predicted lysophospholipase L1 biosynthesis ABC-type transport system permease subunit
MALKIWRQGGSNQWSAANRQRRHELLLLRQIPGSMEGLLFDFIMCSYHFLGWFASLVIGCSGVIASLGIWFCIGLITRVHCYFSYV